MALSRGKASIVAPTTNALAPVLTVLISLAVYQTLPSVYGTLGIVLAIVGSTLMVYGDEKRGEVGAEEQAAIGQPLMAESVHADGSSCIRAQPLCTAL